MKLRFAILLWLLAFPSLWAQHHVTEENFDRGWRFARYGLQPDGSRLDEPRAVENPAFDDSAWRNLSLPHDWGVEGPFRVDLEGFTGKLPWRGIGWYRKRFTLPARDKGKRVFLDFDGAMANAEVYLNGTKVGERPYGYISFRVDLTPHLRPGAENVVAVRLNTEKLGSRWYPGAGIYRHVRLVKTAPVHVAQWGVFVTTPRIGDASAAVSVEVSLENHRLFNVDGGYAVELYELEADGSRGRCVAKAPKRSVLLGPARVTRDSVRLELENPRRWSLEQTNRHLARVTVYEDGRACDVYDTPFGIREIRFTHDDGFHLNGKRVQLNGVCMHHDLGALGSAMNEAALRRQLRVLKSFGCNAIRTSHNPPAPELLTLADEMGFLVMDEAFDSWNYGKVKGDYGSLYKEWHVRDIEDLVCRDRNHPSVIMWSTGNEVHEQYDPACGVARHLTETVHRFDTTRPATFGASYPSRSAVNGTELQVDVHGMNYAAGVYGGPHFYGEFLNKPGHEHLSGYSSESSSTMSSRGEYFPRRYHVSSYDLQEPGWGGLPDWEFAALDRYPGICGEFVWTGFDYLGEPTPFNSDATVLLNHAAAMSAEELAKEKAKLEELNRNRPPSRSSYFGIVDLCGFSKDRYYLYKSRWLPDTPLVHILPHWNFPDRVGKPTPVFVYTSGDEVELFLNGTSLGRKRKEALTYRLRWDSVAYSPGTLRAVAYKQGRQWAETRVETTGEPVALKLSADRPALRPDGQDLVFVRVAFVDKEGREVPLAEPLVKCSLRGRGRIVATDNGDPTCHIPFARTERPAFNGLFLAIVQAEEGQREPVALVVETDSGLKAEMAIPVKKDAKR